MDTRDPMGRYEGHGSWRELVEQLEKTAEQLESAVERSAAHLRIGELWEERFLEKAKAVLHYQHAFKQNSSNGEALTRARRIYREMGKSRMIAQLASLELKLVKDPEGADRDRAVGLYLELGEALVDLGEYDKALQSYKRVFGIVPDHPTAAQAFEDLEIASGWEERASYLADVGRAQADENPALASVMFLRAARLIRRFEADDPRVERFLTTAMVLDPENDVAVNLLENMLEAEGRLDQIRSLHDDVIQGSNDPKVRGRRALKIGSRWAVRFEDRDSAVGYLELAVANDPSLEPAYHWVRSYYGSQENWERVVQIAARAVEAHPPLEAEVAILQDAGEILLAQLGDVARAGAFLSRLGQLVPDHPLWGVYKARVGDAHLGAAVQPLVSDGGGAVEIAIDEECDAPPEDEDESDAVAEDAPGAEVATAAEPEPVDEAPAVIDDAPAVIDDAPAVIDDAPPTPEPVEAAAAEPVEAAAAEPVEAAAAEPVEAAAAAPVEAAAAEPVEAAAAEPAAVKELGPEALEAIEAARVATAQSPTRAIEAWRKVLRFDETNIEALDALLGLFEQMKRWPDLVKTLRAKADAVPDPAEQVALHLNVAELFIERFSNQSEAIKSFERVRELDPANPTALRFLKEMYEKRRDWESLIGIMRTESEGLQDPAERLAANLEMARLAAERLKKPAVCIELWELVRESDPDNAEALSSLGGFYERNKEFEKLADVLEREVKLLSDSQQRAQSLVKLGTIVGEKLGDDARAVEAWSALLEINPDDRRAQEQLKKRYLAMQAWEQLEAFYAQSEKWDELIRTLEREGDREDLAAETRIDLQFKLAELWSAKKERPDRATRCFEKVLELDADNLGSAEALIPMYESSNEHAKLAQVCEVKLRHVEDSFERLELQRKIAGLYETPIGNSAQSFEWFLEAARTDWNEEQTRDDLERLAGKTGRWEEVVAHYRQAADHASDQPEVALRLARVLDEELGRHEEALGSYQSVHEADPTNEAALTGLLRLYATLGRPAELLQVFDRKIELTVDPDEQKAIYYERAVLLEEQIQDLPGAIETYNSILEMAGEEERALRALDRLLEAQEDYPTLAGIIERELAIETDDQAAVVLKYRLGRVRETRLDDAVGAVDCYREILAVDPDHDGAREALEAMLSTPGELQAEVARILDPIYETREEWPKLILALEILASGAEEASERLDLLMRVGRIQQEQLQDFEKAFEAFSRALRAEPSSNEARVQLEQLATVLDWWTRLAELFQWAAQQVEDTTLARELWLLVARVQWEQLESADSSVAAYNQVLEIEPQDATAIEALEAIFRQTERWVELIDVLRRKADLTYEPEAKEALYVQMAGIHDEMLDAPEDAAGCYREILSIDSANVPALRALDRLYQRQEQWTELADNLQQQLALAEAEQEQIGLQLRLAELRETRMEQVEAAIDIHRDVLAQEPTNREALAALERLIALEDHRLTIAQILEPIYETSGEWEKLVGTLEIMIAAAEEPRRQVELLHRVAELFEMVGDDPDKAFLSYARALAVDAGDETTQEHLERLARNLGSYSALAQVYDERAQNLPEPDLAAALNAKVATISEEQLGDADRAVRHWRKVLELDSGSLEAADALVRIFQVTERYEELARILIDKVEMLDDLDERKRHLFQAGEIYETVLERPEEAVAVYDRVLDIDTDDLEALGKLEQLYLRLERWTDLQAVYQRKADLVGSVEEKKELLYVMGAVYEREVQDVEKSIDTYQRVLELDPDDLQAMQRLDVLYQQSNQWHELLAILEREAELVQNPDEVIGFKFRVGNLWERHLDDVARAVEVYREVLSVVPDHPESIGALEGIVRGEREPMLAAEILEQLYQEAAEWRKLIDVLEVQLSHSEDQWERVQLLHRIAGLYESDLHLSSATEAFDAFARAFVEDAANDETLAALDRLAEATGRWRELAALFDDQLGKLDDPERIVDIGLRVARVLEERLGNAEEAITRHRKVLEHDGENREALGALDRLFQITEKWQDLSEILRQEAAIAPDPEDSLDFQFRLGQVFQVELENIDEAIECYRDILAAAPEHASTLQSLELLFADGHKQPEISEILDPLYRMAQAWDKLVGITEALLVRVEDADERVALMHRIAEIYEEKLQDEVSAFGWYGNAVRQLPTDERSLRDLERLAASTHGWPDAIAVYADVFEQAGESLVKQHAALRMARAFEEELGDAESAEQTYRKVLELDPYEPAALEALDRIYLNYVEWERLAEILAKRIEVATSDEDRVMLLYRLGKVFEEQLEDFDRAIAAFRRIVQDLAPDNAEALDSLETIYFRRDDYPALLEVFERKLEIAPSDSSRADLLAKMAVTAAEALDQVEQGVELWGRVLDIRGEDGEALAALGGLYARQENWRELVDVLERQAQIAEDDETRIRIYQELGSVWGERLGRDRNALENWERVLDIDPGNLTALRALAAIHQTAESWEDLVQTLHRMIDVGSLEMEAAEQKACYSRLGALYAETLQQPFDAIEAWRKVLDVDPSEMEAIEALERLYVGEGQWEDLVGVLDRKAPLLTDPESRIDVLLQVTATWEERIGEPEKALSAYERVLEADPLHDQAFEAVERLYGAEMRWEDLTNLYLARIGHLTEAKPRVELYQRMAKVYEQHLGSAQNAFLILQKAFEEDYSNDITAKELERLAGLTGQWNELLNSCNQVLETVQDRAIQVELCVKIGRWYAELERPDYAIFYFNRVLQIDAEHTGALSAMADIYRGKGQFDALAQVLTRQAEVSKEDEERRDTYFALGELYEEKLGDVGRALASYRSAAQIDERHLESLGALERLYRASLAWSDVIPVLEKRIEALEDPDEIVEIRHQIGEIYELRLSDVQSAIEAYREILQHDASYMPALKGLEGLFSREERWQDLLDILEMQLEVVTSERERISLLLRMASMFEEEFVKPEQAAEKLEAVLDIDTANESALTGLERIYRQGQKWHDLVQTYYRHIEATPDRQARTGLYHQVAQVYAEELGDAHSAIDALRNVLAIDDDDPKALDALARLFDRIEDWSGAHETLSRLVQVVVDPAERVGLYFRLGQLLDQRMGDQGAAVDQYRNALDIEPGHLPSLSALRRIYYDRQDWLAAARVLEQEQEYTELDRQRSSLLYELGRVNEQHLDDHPRAVECYELSLQCDAENVNAAMPLVEVYAEQSRWDDAERLLDMLVRKAPTFKPEPAQMQRFQFLLGEACAALEKDEKALKGYRAAYDIDATHLPTLRGIAALYFKAKDWDKSFKFYQMILVHHREAQSPEQIVDIFYRLGIIKLEVGERRKALNMFDKALEIDQLHRPTLEAVIGLHEKQGDWEKVIHFKKAVLQAATDEERFDVLVQIGDIWQEKLQNSQKAIQSYNDGLELQPENHVLLHKVLTLYTNTEQWPQAVEVIVRVAGLEKNPQRAAKYYNSIALIYRDKIKDPDQSVEFFNRCLDEDPEQLKAFEAIDRIITQKKDWKNLERNYRKMLHRIGGKGKTEIEVNLWHFLGEIYRTRMGKFEPAAEAFRMASRLDPDNLQRHTILAELYQSIPDQWEHAVEEHQFLIRKNPYRVDSYKALRKIYFDTRQYDKAWCLCATLTFLKKADDEEQQFYEQYKTKGMIRAQARLDNERWIKDLFHPDENLYIGKMYETILPAVRQFKVQPQKAFGLKKKDKHDPMTSTITFAKTFAYVAQVLNLPLPELYLRPDQAMGLQYAITNPPASVVGALLLSGFTPQDLTFEIGRHLAYYRGEHYIRWVEPTTAGLRVLLLAAIKCVNPKFQTPPDPTGVLDQTVAALNKALMPTAREQLAALVKKFIESAGEADIKKWVNAVEMSACRGGFLLCNDIQSAARMIQNQATSVGDVPPKEKIKELVLFSVSENYFRLRQALGVTIGQ